MLIYRTFLTSIHRNSPPLHPCLIATIGIDNPANVYFCELDVFYALMGITKETEPSTLQQQLLASSQPPSPSLSQPQSQAPNLVVAYEWISRAHKNAILCKGRDSSAATRCQQFMNILKDCIVLP